jgi:hypothetical protein
VRYCDGWHSYSHVTKFRHKVFVFLCTAITLIVWSRSWRQNLTWWFIRFAASAPAMLAGAFDFCIWFGITFLFTMITNTNITFLKKRCIQALTCAHKKFHFRPSANAFMDLLLVRFWLINCKICSDLIFWFRCWPGGKICQSANSFYGRTWIHHCHGV